MPAAAEADRKTEVKVRGRCRHCGRLQTRRGRAGIYWRCKFEDCRSKKHRGLNMGPAMELALASPVELQRQRRRRQPATANGAAPPRRRTNRTTPAAAGAGEETPPPAPATSSAAAPRRRTKRATPASAPVAPASATPAPTPAGSSSSGGWRRILIGTED